MPATRTLARFARPLCALLVLAVTASAARAEYQLEPAFPALEFTSPTDVQPAVDGTNRMFVLEKRGIIWVFEADYNTTDAHVFLNLIGKVRTSGEAGLLGLAFHPDYAANGEFFVFYITPIPSRTIVARYRVSDDDPNAADPASEVILIDVPQPTVFHNGGQLEFGPDGYLYVAMGDNRVEATAQDLSDLPGSILRIDVDADPGPPIPYPPYAIPPDNPFANNADGYRPEIYAYGFRNPWRFSIDDKTRELWVCDVGEDTYEEIDIVAPGRNYGWPLMDGPACFPLGAPCDTAGRDLRLPLYTYKHDEGDAIVGGRRYWGSRLPELAGVFIFADYTSGMIWGLHYDGAGTPERFDLAPHGHVMLTVGAGPNGEVLIGALDGQIYRLGRATTGVTRAPVVARLLNNFPNPFNPATTIRFTLARSAVVRLDIVSVRGEHVRRFEFPRLPSGAHEVAWDGETDAHARAASGVYFCRLVVDGRAVDAARMTLIR
jgi:glucose/arabinose dehydrogenase